MVSVIIPCYNAENWIGQTLESVLAQTYFPLEIIVVNDASTDQSREIIAKYPQVKIIDLPENKGIYHALRLALEASSGKWIQILDADDILLPQKIEKQVFLLTQNCLEIACTHYLRFEENKILLEYKKTTNLPEIDLIRKNWYPPACFLLSRNLALQCELSSDFKIFGDVWFFWQAVFISKKMIFVEEILVKYRVSADSFSRKHGLLFYFQEKFLVTQKIQNHLPTINSEFKEVFLESYRDCCKIFVDLDRTLFEDCLEKIFFLEPKYIPKRSFLMKCASFFFGYRRAEIIANYYRKKIQILPC